MTTDLVAGLKWIAPHGLVRFLSQARASRAQTLRQQKLFKPFVPAGSVVFDIGANAGNRIAALLDCGAKVVAVEPQPDCVARLRKRYGARATIIQAAAGSAAGRLPLLISGRMDPLASLSPEFIATAKKSQRFGDREWARTIEVDVLTLDSLVQKYGLPAFIKIDVEGFEFEVLRGLSQPADVVSFEWTPDMPEPANRCIDYLVKIGLPYFQFSFGESMVFALRRSLDGDGARQLVTLLGAELHLFGDIYASRQPLERA